MAGVVFTWPGTQEEADALQAIVYHHCTQQQMLSPEHGQVCGAHALLRDERAVQSLLFWRRYMARRPEAWLWDVRSLDDR